MASSSTPLRAPRFDDTDEETGLPISELRALLAKGDACDPAEDVPMEDGFAEIRAMHKAKYGLTPEEHLALADSKGS